MTPAPATRSRHTVRVMVALENLDWRRHHYRA